MLLILVRNTFTIYNNCIYLSQFIDHLEIQFLMQKCWVNDDCYIIPSRVFFVHEVKPTSVAKINTYWNEDVINFNGIRTHGLCSANAEAMGSDPIEAPKTFCRLNLRLLKSQSQLRWSHLHFICMSAVHIIFINVFFFVTSLQPSPP